MYRRKSAGPRMEPWGTPTLIGYSCGDFPFRATWSCLLLRKEEIRPNILPEIPWDLRHTKCYSSSSPKAIAILSDTDVRRSAAAQEDLKLNWKSGKKNTFL